jgi:hypothetical protein
LERPDIIEAKNKLDSQRLFKVLPLKEVVKRSKPHKHNAYFELSYPSNVSPQNSNAIIKKASGKSASELVAERVLLESERYLFHTDKAVSDIAFFLCFSHPSHFVKHLRIHAF